MSSIDSDKLREAKEKLACHIQPPGTHSPWADAVAAPGNTGSSARDGMEDITPSAAEPGEIDTPSRRIRLTEMTAAGG